MAESVTGMSKRRLVLHFGLKDTILACDKASDLKTNENVSLFRLLKKLRSQRLFANTHGADYAHKSPVRTKRSLNGRSLTTSFLQLSLKS